MRSVEDILSPLEAEVVGLILKGYSSKEISAILKISAETVKTHRKNSYMKLEVSTVAEQISRLLNDGKLAAKIPPTREHSPRTAIG
ncbi:MULTISPECIES: response regulator transcription factor [Pseudomonas]|uniref:response regulator transcription factor n=1 Tax=Pseudomonas TaxID=286 RepID=UPI002361E11E|nr:MULTISPECIES: helix-turn-helix transcriptional regulator [Pseudomonas]WJV25533.1 helix-turn-helix transcriptional regulator [Pseudomonas chlororaphis]